MYDNNSYFKGCNFNVPEKNHALNIGFREEVASVNITSCDRHTTIFSATADSSGREKESSKAQFFQDNPGFGFKEDDGDYFSHCSAGPKSAGKK